MPDLATSLIAWYSTAARDLPWRDPDCGPWGVLVSEFMLQQTPVARVLEPWRAWLDRWPRPAALASERPAEAVRQWATLGYPRRALWLHRAAVQITERHDGQVPTDLHALLALQGVGDYTARAVAVFAYGARHPVVDTNTRRVLARVLAARAHPGPPARRDLADLDPLLPTEPSRAAIANAAFMELGALVCTATTPRCEGCPVAGSCAWRAAGYPDTGDSRRRQAPYSGSDRHARGDVLKELRGAPGPLPLATVARHWPDPVQRDRALASLTADGLVEQSGGLVGLPGTFVQ